MAIDVKNYHSLHPGGLAGNTALSLRQNQAGEQTGFNEILINSLQKTNTSAQSYIDTQSLSREQLDLLVQNMQIQMNRRLFNIAFNGNGENIIFPGNLFQFAPNSMAGSSLEVSKYRQLPPKNNVNPASGTLNDIIEKAAKRYDVDPDLIRSVIKAESNFDSKALSPKGAVGLMQLMPETAKELGVKNAYDPEENVMGGTKYLKMLLDRYGGEIDIALAAYNWGMGNLERNSGRLPLETKNYIARIDEYYRDIKASA